MKLKYLIPLSVRNQLRPSWQSFQRRWHESAFSPKPKDWHPIRESVHTQTDLESLLRIASSEFGITQIRSEITTLLENLYNLAPTTVVEIGTHKGGNSFLFCHALPSVRRVVGIDLDVQNAPKLIYFTRPGQVYRPVHRDSQTTQTRDDVLKQLEGQPVDFLFIDGDHSYKGVKADFELYSSLVRPGGIVALHDIVPDHRTRYGRDTGCYSGEVYLFWNELKERYDCEELIENSEQDGFGIGLVRIPSSSTHPTTFLR
jgi:predicted O-methyltransferase YrrM